MIRDSDIDPARLSEEFKCSKQSARPVAKWVSNPGAAKNTLPSHQNICLPLATDFSADGIFQNLGIAAKLTGQNIDGRLEAASLSVCWSVAGCWWRRFRNGWDFARRKIQERRFAHDSTVQPPQQRRSRRVKRSYDLNVKGTCWQICGSAPVILFRVAEGEVRVSLCCVKREWCSISCKGAIMTWEGQGALFKRWNPSHYRGASDWRSHSSIQ
jgi:hypothetical protein